MGGLGLIKSLAEKEKQLLERLEAAKTEAEERVKRAEAEAKAVREKAMARLDEAVALVLKEVLP